MGRSWELNRRMFVLSTGFRQCLCSHWRDLDGLARISATGFSELRNAVFANVAQQAIRKISRDTFGHLLALDSRFHLSRQTGGLTRAIDRGTKCVCHTWSLISRAIAHEYIVRGITFLLSSMIFHIIPTALEITMVCGILVRLMALVRTPQLYSRKRKILPNRRISLELTSRL